MPRHRNKTLDDHNILTSNGTSTSWVNLGSTTQLSTGLIYTGNGWDTAGVSNTITAGKDKTKKLLILNKIM